MSKPWRRLYTDILTSTVWESPPAFVKVWITLVSLADDRGDVWCTEAALSRNARLKPSIVKKALAMFLAPDSNSRDQSHEGRRLLPLSRGWHLTTFEKRQGESKLKPKTESTRNQVGGVGSELKPKTESSGGLTSEYVRAKNPQIEEIEEIDQTESRVNAESAVSEPTNNQPLPTSDISRLKSLQGRWMARFPLKPKTTHRLSENFDLTLLPAWESKPSDLTIDLLEERVSWRLEAFDADDRAERQQYLGLLSSFIRNGTWKKQVQPNAEPEQPKDQKLLPSWA